VIISPFLTGCIGRVYAAIFSFMAGVIWATGLVKISVTMLGQFSATSNRVNFECGLTARQPLGETKL